MRESLRGRSSDVFYVGKLKGTEGVEGRAPEMPEVAEVDSTSLEEATLEGIENGKPVKLKVGMEVPEKEGVVPLRPGNVLFWPEVVGKVLFWPGIVGKAPPEEFPPPWVGREKVLFWPGIVGKAPPEEFPPPWVGGEMDCLLTVDCELVGRV